MVGNNLYVVILTLVPGRHKASIMVGKPLRGDGPPVTPPPGSVQSMVE